MPGSYFIQKNRKNEVKNMLEIKTTSITLRGTSVVKTEDGETPVMNMSATINEMGHSSDNYTITNQEVYEKNKAAIRADKDAFIAKIREIEDTGIEAVTE